MAFPGPGPDTSTPIGQKLLGATLPGIANLTGSISSPITVAAGYGAWYAAPSIWPDAGSLISAKIAGTIDDSLFERAMRYNGIPLTAYPGRPNTHLAWQSIIAAQQPMFGVENAIKARNAGIISDGWLQHELNRAGYPDPWRKSAFRLMANPVDLELITKLDRLGVDLPAGAEFWYSLAGYDKDADYGRRSIIQADRKLWSPEEGITLVSRGLLTSDELSKNLKAGHYITDRMVDQARSLALPLPTLNDALSLYRAGGMGFDGGAIDPLLVEMPDWIRDIARWDSKFRPMGTYTDAQGGLAQLTPMHLQWASHWRNPNLVELSRMRAVARPDTVQRWQQLGLTTPPITNELIRFVMRAEGIHPAYRDQLIAASYNYIGVRQMIMLARYQELTLDECRNHAKSEGYAPDDAESMAKGVYAHAQEMLSPWTRSIPDRERQQLADATVEAYEFGVYSRDIAIRNLVDLKLTPERAGQSVDDALKKKNLSDVVDAAKRINALVDRTVDQQIEAILTRYRSRDLPRGPAIVRLESLNVSPADAVKLVDAAAASERARRASQKHELTERYRLDSTQRLLSGVQSAYEYGLMTRIQANAALLQAGLPQDAIAAHLDYMETLANLREVRVTVSAVRSQYLHGELTQADSVALLIRAGLSPDAAALRTRYWSVSLHAPRKIVAAEKLLAWVARGLMPSEVARTRLLNMGWQGVDAQIALASAEQSLNKIRAGQAKALSQSRLTAAKQLSSLAKQADLTRRKLQSDIKRLTPIATIGKWVKAGIMKPATARERLILMGEPHDIADLYLEEWANESTKQSSKKSVSKNVTPSNGATNTTPGVP